MYVATAGYFLVGVGPCRRSLDPCRVDRVVAGGPRRPRGGRVLAAVPPSVAAAAGALVGRVDIRRHVAQLVVVQIHQAAAVVVVETVDVGASRRSAAEMPRRLDHAAVVRPRRTGRGLVNVAGLVRLMMPVETHTITIAFHRRKQQSAPDAATICGPPQSCSAQTRNHAGSERSGEPRPQR